MMLIPKPNGNLTQEDGFFNIQRQMTVNLGGFDGECLAAFSERTGIRCEKAKADADFTLFQDDSLAPEGYKLNVSPCGIDIRSKTEAGVILALTTLYVSCGSEGVPCFCLDDEPKYSYRGLLLDCARHFFSVCEIKKIIEQISLVKLNRLHWHLTDDQGWRMESAAYPALHEGIPYYTRGEIKEIVRYARERNVEIIPEIDMPGHSTSLIHVMPWLSCTQRQVDRASSGGIYKTILCAGKESTYDFIFKLLDEVTELFPSRYIHIGGDEVPKMEWRACEVCKKRLAELGSESFEDLQGYFTGRAAEYLHKKGREIICWNETLRAEKLPEHLTIQYWMPGEDDAKVSAFLNSGHKVVFSDMFKLYFDYPHAMTSLQRVYEYVPSISGDSCENSAHGVEACLWSERIDTEQKLEMQIFPRVFALAEVAWSHDKDIRDFEKRLKQKLGRLSKDGIAYTEKYNPSPLEKLAGLKSFAAGFSQATENRDENKLDISEIFDGEKFKAFLVGFGLDPGLIKAFGGLFGNKQQ